MAVVSGAGLLALAASLTGCSAATPQVVVVTATETVAADTPAETGVTAPESDQQEAPDDKPVKSKRTKEPAKKTFTMPDEVGANLQDAQDDIQRVTGDEYFYTSSTDALGASRMQIIDSNWQVCSQNVKPGAQFDADADISFAAVKLDEDCP